MAKEKLTIRLKKLLGNKTSIHKDEVYSQLDDVHPKAVGKSMSLIGWKLDKADGYYRPITDEPEPEQDEPDNDIPIYTAFKLLLDTFKIDSLSIALAMMKLIEAEVGIGEKKANLDGAIAFIQRERNETS